MKEMMLQTEKGRVFYWRSDDWRADAETIFFLHGLTADHTMFAAQTACFQPEHNLIAWDAPGHGRSRPFESFTFQDAAGYIKSILDACSVSKAVLVGQSLGGICAQAFIKRYPDRVKGLVTIGSAPYGCGYYSKFDLWIVAQVERMARLYPFQWMKKAMSRRSTTTPWAYENMLQMLAPYEKRELCRLLGLGLNCFLEDNCDLELTCPVLLISGDKDRIGRLKHYNQEWAKKTGYPLRIVSGAGHNANVDKPEEVNACIRDFLQQLGR